MKRWIAGWVMLGMVAGCSVADQPWWPGSESTEVIEPPTASTDGAAVVGRAEPLVPAGVPPTQPAATSPYEGHELTGKPMVVEAVALTVNDQAITVSEILHSAHKPLQAAGRGNNLADFAATAQKIIRDEIQRQIGQALIVERATEELSEGQIAYVDQLVDQRIRDMVLAHGGSQARLAQELVADGTTLEAARTALRRQLLSELYVQMKLGGQAGISRRDLWRYYQGNRGEFTQPAKVKMQIVAFPYRALWPGGVSVPTSEQRQSAANRAAAGAAAALKRIRGGTDFTTVVKEDSVSPAFRSRRGGVWDFMAAGSFVEVAVEQAAFDMQPGEVSDVIVGQTGAFIVKTLGRQDGRTVPFEQAQGQIRKALLARQREALSRQYDDELRQRAVIVQAEAFESYAMDRAVGLYHQPGRGR